MSINLMGLTLANETLQLAPPSSMVITRAWDSPAVRLDITIPHREAVDDLTRIQVSHGEEVLFAGFCDELVRLVDGSGAAVSISARTPGALLCDNEALPKTYTDITAQGFFNAEIRPLGFTALTVPDASSAAEFQLNKGHSVWEAFCLLCFRLYGREPHITADNALAVETLTGADPVIISNNAAETGVLRYCSLEFTTRRSSALSSIVYRDVGGAYSQLYQNPFGNDQQVRRNRYVIPAAEFTPNPALDGYRRILKGQLGLHSARVAVPGLCNIYPGRAVYLKDPLTGERLMAAYQVKIIYTESGCLTRLVLADPAYM